MFCGKCGAKINEGAKFCTKCGEAHNFVENFDIERSDNSISTNQLNEYNDNDRANTLNKYDNTRKSSNKALYIICAIVGLAVIGVVIFFVLSNQNKSDNNMSKNYASESDAESTKKDLDKEQNIADSQENAEDTQDSTEILTQEPESKEVSSSEENKNPDLTTEETVDSNQADINNSISVEYLDSAPSITSPIKKIPVYNVSSSSMLEEELNNATYLNYPFYMFDGDDKTSWQEGVEGTGSGESAGIYLDGVFEVKYICFKLGNWTSEKWYEKNPRPKTLTLNIEDELIDLSFPDGMVERWVKIENAPKSSYLYLYLGDVYPGTEYEDTCINEIEFYGTWYENVDY